MFWKKKNPLLKLRNELLEGKIALTQFKGKNEIAVIITDIGLKSGGISIVYLVDGTCSLYFEKAGGIIGAGGHENIQIISGIYFDFIDSNLNLKVDAFDKNFPKQDCVSIKIITKSVKYQINDSTSNSGAAFVLANNLLTQFRLISENKNKPLSNDSVLLSFIKENNVKAVQIALNKLQNPNALIEDKSAVIIATYKRNKKIIESLINSGAEIDFREKTGMNALMIASYLGYSELIDILSNNKTINSKDSNGYTPLMFASNADHFDCVEKLISLQADVNSLDKDNSTPIMFAAQNGSYSIVKLLLEKGADISIVGSHGYSALTLAELNNNKSIIEILKK